MSQLLSRLGLRYPIIQGPFGGGLSTTRLVAAVSNAGGMGSFGAHLLSPDQLHDLATEIRSLTTGPFALNLWVSSNDVPPGNDASIQTEADFTTYRDYLQPIYDKLGVPPPTYPAAPTFTFEQQAEAIIRIRPAVFSFVFGIPSKDILSECRKQGIFTLGAATTLDEALLLEEAGIDSILATGFEAGGHRVSFHRPAEDSLHGTMSLTRLIVAKTKLPVIAAGGIADGHGITAALALGAQAVQLGTAFLACEESGTTPFHRQQLFSPAARHTQLTRVFTGRLARFIKNPLLHDLETHAPKPLPYPIQSALAAPIKKHASEQQDADHSIHYSGQGAPLLKHHHAADLIASLIAEAKL